MKLVLTALATLLFTASAFAGVRTIKVTSFYYVDSSNNASNLAAELCGIIEGGARLTDRIVVEVDPNFNQGNYTILPDGNGNFCTVVRTVTGKAIVRLWATSAKSMSMAKAVATKDKKKDDKKEDK